MFYLRNNEKELIHANVISLKKKNLQKRALPQIFILLQINKYKSNIIIDNNTKLPLISPVFSGKIRTEKK